MAGAADEDDFWVVEILYSGASQVICWAEDVLEGKRRLLQDSREGQCGVSMGWGSWMAKHTLHDTEVFRFVCRWNMFNTFSMVTGISFERSV